MKKLFFQFTATLREICKLRGVHPCEEINIYGAATLRVPLFLVRCVFGVNEIRHFGTFTTKTVKFDNMQAKKTHGYHISNI